MLGAAQLCAKVRHTLPVSSVVDELVYGVRSLGGQIIVLQTSSTACQIKLQSLLFAWTRAHGGGPSQLCTHQQYVTKPVYYMRPHAATESQRSCREAAEGRTPDAMFARVCLPGFARMVQGHVDRSQAREPEAEANHPRDPSLS